MDFIKVCFNMDCVYNITLSREKKNKEIIFERHSFILSFGQSVNHSVSQKRNKTKQNKQNY